MRERATTIILEVKESTVGKSFKKVFAEFLYPIVILFLIISIIIPTFVYFMVYDMGPTPEEEIGTCVIDKAYRVPCGFKPINQIIGNLTQNECTDIRCCYDHFTKECYHFLPAKYGFRLVNDKLYTRKIKQTPLGNPMHVNLSIAINDHANYLQVKLMPVQNDQQRMMAKFNDLTVKVYNETLAVDIYRDNDPDDKILQTSRGPLIASDDYWEWTMELTRENDTLYGLGGLHISGNLTKVIYKSEVDHTSLPFFLVQHDDAFHAVLIEHKGLLEIEVLASKMIVMRGLNTDGLGLRVYAGPTLEDIYQQRQGASTVNVEDIPRWLLGTHMCPNHIVDVENGDLVVRQFKEQQRNLDNFKPESDCFNEMFMIILIESTEFERGTDRINTLKNVVAGIKGERKFMLPFSPHIPIGDYQLYDETVLLKNSSKQVHEGFYKERKVGFLDFFHKDIENYVEILFRKVDQTIGIDNIDGFYIIDNWGQDELFNFNATEENLIYYDQEITTALNKSLPWGIVSQQENYINEQIKVLRKVVTKMTKNKPIIISSAYYANMQTPIFPTQVNLTWTNLKASTSKYLFHNLFTHPLSLSPVCGTTGRLNKTQIDNDMCSLWFINSATQPGRRLTTDWFRHANFSGTSKHIAQKALKTARMLSYYQYDILQTTGFASKPMFMDFHTDNETWTLDEQYMLGDLLVVNLVLPKIKVSFYLPEKHDWFEFWGGHMYGNKWITMAVAKNEQIMFVKEGSIVPLIEEDYTIPVYFKILIATHCNETEMQKIKGNIRFDREILGLELLVDEVKGVQLQFSNVLKVKDEVCVNPSVHTSKIGKFQVYHCTQETIFKEEIYDLCEDFQEDVVLFSLND